MTIITVISQQPLTTEQVNSFKSVPSGGLDGQVLTKASNSNFDVVWEDAAGGSSTTNLSVANKTTTTFDILSSTGTDVTLPAATTTEAGLLIATDKVKLNNLGTASYLNVPASGNAANGEVVKGNDTRLSDARTPLGHSHVIADVTGLQTALDGKFNNPIGDTTQYIAGDGSLISFPVAGQAGTLVRQVRNEIGTTLTKGTVIYLSGASGNKPLAQRAIANSELASDRTFGIVQADISNNNNGYCVVNGDLGGLNTSALTEGAILYLSDTVAGGSTTTPPVAPNHAVVLGIVTRSHVTQGQFDVAIQNGFELDDLHDISITSVANKDVLSYETSTGLWKNKQLATSDVVGLDTALSGKQPLATVLTNTTASFTTTLETKLNGVATGATANSSDATLLNRANHTGTQLASTISDFNTAADARVVAGITGKENTITAGTTAQYWRGDKSWQTLDKTSVGLGNVDNTSDTTKNAASVTLTNKTISGASNTLTNIAQASVTNLTTDLSNKQPLDGDLTAIAALAGTSGFLKKTAVDTWTLDTNSYYLASNPSGYTTNTGTVTTASVVSANGFAGSVATAGTTPAITISTTITGLLKGNGTAISAAVSGTDYLSPTGNGSGLTSFTSGQITTALGFTPYNATNPAGYTSNIGTVTTFSFTNGGGFTGTVSTAGTTPTLSLVLQNATTSQSGQLTSTDWNTFNGKQAALNGTGFVKVTGTTVSYDNSTYLTGNQTITVTGDVSGSGTTAITLNLGSNIVTNAKLAQVPTATFKGRITASTGNVEDLTAAQATSLLDTFTTSTKGLVGASGGGTTNFLRADGTWAAPAGGGGGLTLTEFEVDFGTKPIRSKKFTITAAGVSGSSKVIVSPSGNVATGRVGDDWEWDSISTSAKAGTGQFVLTCFASGKVAGKRKFYYTYS